MAPIHTDDYLEKLLEFKPNRRQRRARIINRLFCKKGYRYGRKLKTKR